LCRWDFNTHSIIPERFHRSLHGGWWAFCKSGAVVDVEQSKETISGVDQLYTFLDPTHVYFASRKWGQVAIIKASLALLAEI